jgi:hypothetical protein
MSCLRNKLKLRLAAREGDTATARTLLSTSGAPSLINYKDANGATPLFIAAEKGHAVMTEQLIEARGNIDVQDHEGCTPLYIVANIDVQDHEGCTPLYIALSHWVFARKFKIIDGKNVFDCWKARLVFNGKHQNEHGDTYSPTPTLTTIRLMLATC